MRLELARRLVEARKASGWAKQYLAAEALGVHPVVLCCYEKGKHGVPVEVLFRMCDLYGISVDSLRGITNTVVDTADNAVGCTKRMPNVVNRHA